jgi:hypothetical protein
LLGELSIHFINVTLDEEKRIIFSMKQDSQKLILNIPFDYPLTCLKLATLTRDNEIKEHSVTREEFESPLSDLILTLRLAIV